MAKEKKFKLGPIQRAWVRALRSGKYKQGGGKLTRNDKHCCLGVLCQLALKAKIPLKLTNDDDVILYDGEKDYLPRKVRLWAGLRNERGDYGARYDLTEVNDNPNSFKHIAGVIEENAAKLFRRSV